MTELLYRPESEEELYALMPRFLKEDRNTRALIAAACHMVFRFLQAVEHAIVELTDIDRMSEEALDEKTLAGAIYGTTIRRTCRKNGCGSPKRSKCAGASAR